MIRPFLKNLCALAFGILLAAVLLEAALRIYNPFPFRLKGNVIYLQTNRRIVIDNNRIRGTDRTIIHTKNSLGFRGKEKPADFDRTLSIITVGGSTTECYYISDGKTWPDRLGELLGRDYRSVWLNNAGLDGHSTFGHYVLMKEFVAPLKPKVIIFLVGLNDIDRTDLKEDKSNLNDAAQGVERLMRKSELAFTFLNLKRALLAQKMGLTHSSWDLASMGTADLASGTIETELERHRLNFLEPYRRRLELLIDLCSERDILPVLVTQPMLFGKGIDRTTGVDLEAIRTQNGKNGKLDWMILELYNEVTRGEGRRRNVPVIDLAREMPKDSAFFYDNIHFTDSGNGTVADILYRRLVPVLNSRYPDYRR